MRTDAKLGIAATALALATCLLAPGVTARPGAQAPEAQAPGGQPTFRAGTRLATFDAVVTDCKGRHVTDLTPADFEVVERGRRQTVRQVAYVHAVRPDGAPTAAAGADAPAAPAPAMPSASGLPSREQTGRVMAIVVDDLRMSLRSTVDVRTMLNRYVDRQLRPGDLVAIIRTAGGAGALQQFTSDRRLLKAAAERVRASARVLPSPTPYGPWGGDGEGLADRFERDVTLEGSLGALAYVVRGIQALPGRKTVVFVSEGFHLATADNRLNDALPQVDHVIDTANRGGVVMYAIDPQGLVNPVMAEFSAQRSRSDPSYTGTSMAIVAPSSFVASRALFETQGSLEYLAGQTGGFAVVSNNDLTGGLSPHRGGHARLLPDRLRHRDPGGRQDGQGRGQDPREAQGPRGAGAPGPLRPGRPGRAAPDATGRPAALGRALAVHDRRAGRAARRAVRPRHRGGRLRTRVRRRRSGRTHARRSSWRRTRRQPDDARVRPRRRRRRGRPGARGHRRPARRRRLPSGPPARPPLQRPAPVQEGGRLPDPRRHPRRTLAGDRRERAVRRSAARRRQAARSLGRRPDRGERRREVDDRDVRPWEPDRVPRAPSTTAGAATAASRSAPRCCATASWFTQARARRSPARPRTRRGWRRSRSAAR